MNVHRILIFSYFLLAEIDRVNWQAEMEGAEALQNHYQGSIRHASCSEVRDEVNVRNEIGHQVDEVDKVAQVLLKAGISRLHFELHICRRVEILHAGFVQLAVPAIVLGPLLLTGSGSWGNILFCLMKQLIQLQKSLQFGCQFNAHPFLPGLSSCVCFADVPSMNNVSC